MSEFVNVSRRGKKRIKRWKGSSKINEHSIN